MSGEMPPPPPRSARRSADKGLLRTAVHKSTSSRGPGRDSEDAGLVRVGTPQDIALPLPWDDYFDTRSLAPCDARQATFNVYQAGSSGPVVLCLHGGGYTGLSWALFAQHLKGRCRVVAPDLRGHGLSTSSSDADLSAATLAADVAALWQHLFASTAAAVAPAVPAPHTTAACSAAGSVPAAAAVPAASTVPARVPATPAPWAATSCSAPAPQVPTVLVGHSMGGAIAVHAAALNEIPGLAGVVVIDVVEGTALASLPFMEGVLQGRPQRFADLGEAVEWAMATGMCRHREAAHISLPSMLRQVESVGGRENGREDGEGGAGTAAEGVPGEAGLPPTRDGALAAAADMAGINSARRSCGEPPSLGILGIVREEEEVEGVGEEGGEGATAGSGEVAGAGAGAAERAQQQQQEQRQQERWLEGLSAEGTASVLDCSGSGGGWVWRTPLRESSRYWDGWYRGLSDAFLGLKVPKVLILAGTDRLDRQLTIGQMQGRFQLVLLPRAGHAVHEDEPERTAEAVGAFMHRFRVGEPPLQLPRAALGVAPVLPIAAGPPI